MTTRRQRAKEIVDDLGYEPAIRHAEWALKTATSNSDFKSIEAAMYWRELLVEMLALKPKALLRR
jgi:hypothetical protein